MRSPIRRAKKELYCVILAAGASTRLGKPKQLLRRRAKPLLLDTAELAKHLRIDRIVVVLGADALRLRGLLRRCAPYVRAVVNARWQEGISGSLRTGLSAAPAKARAALILLTDQPAVGQPALIRLLTCWRRRPTRAAAAFYSNNPGVPAILPRKIWRKINALRGDRGARSILRVLDDVATVPMPEAEYDIDTPEDARALRYWRAGVAQLTQPEIPLE